MVPKHQVANRKCGYKYALLSKENKVTYEEIVEFKSYGVDFINRCLVIDKEYAAKNSKLPQT